MALTTTTLASAVAANDVNIVVTSAAGLAAGMLMYTDQEWLQVVQSYVSGTTVGVLRGRSGSVNGAHVSGANITFGVASDFPLNSPQTYTMDPIAGRARTITSYGANGAITLPVPGADAVAMLNGTNALAMTLAVPTKDMDGCILHIIANGSAAHTVTVATDFNNASGLNLATFASGGRQWLQCMASNGIWCVPATQSGTTTNIAVAIT